MSCEPHNNGTRGSGSLRNKNETLGWFRPCRKRVVKRDLKACSNRDVLKNMKYLGLMPARSMNLIKAQYDEIAEMNEMMAMIGEELLPNPYVDFNLLNSKIIMKALWSLSDKNSIITGLTAKGSAYYKKHYGWSWHNYSDNRLFTRSVQMKMVPMKEEFKDETSTGRLRLKKTLLYILRKNGGIVTIVNKEREFRPDAVGDIIVYGRNVNKYCSFPCWQMPTVQCGFCGCYNLYSHLDCGQTLNDATGIWRCAACYGNLEYKYEDDYVEPISEAHIDTMLGIHGGSNIDQLLLLKYGDVYDDLNAEGRKKFLQEDMALMRKYFNNSYHTVVQIGTNLSRMDREWLTENFPRTTLIYHPASNTLAGLVEYELHCIITDLASMTINDTIKVFGYNGTLKPINYMRVVDSIDSCDLYIGADVEYNQSQLTSIFNRDKMVLLPNISSDNNAIAAVRRLNNDLIYTWGGSSMLKRVNLQLVDLLTRHDLILTNNGKFIVSVAQETDNWLLYKIQKVDTSEDLSEWKKTTYQTTRTITVPLPDIHSRIGTNEVQLWRPTTMRLDDKLFNMLLIRDLAGNLSFDTLREFAVGFALRSYSVKGKVMRNLAVTHDMIEHHVLLAKIVTNVMNANTRINHIVPKLTTIPIVKSVITTITELIITAIKSSLNITLTDVHGMNIINLIENLLSTGAEYVEGWNMDQNTLENLATGRKVTSTNLRIARLTLGSQIKYKDISIHKNCNCSEAKKAKPTCIQCNWAAVDTEGQTCSCCHNIASSSKVFGELEDNIKIVERITKNAHKKQKLITNQGIESIKTKAKQKEIKLANIVVQDLKQSARPNNSNEDRLVTEENYKISLIHRDPEPMLRNNEVAIEPFMSVIKYNLPQVTVTTQDWFKIISFDKNDDGNNLNCGRNALSKCLNIDLPTSLFMTDDGLISASELIKYAKDNQFNLLVLHKHGAMVTKNKPSDKYYTIIHGSLIDGIDDNHFMPAKVTQIRLMHAYVNDNDNATSELVDKCIKIVDDGMDFENVDHDTNLIVRDMIVKLMDDYKSNFWEFIPKIVIIGGQPTFTNNEEDAIHDVYNCKYHMPIRDDLADAYSVVADLKGKHHEDPMFSNYFDTRDTVDTDIELRLNMELIATVKQMQHILFNLHSHGKISSEFVHKRYKVDIINTNTACKVNRLFDKLKSMDMVLIKYNAKVTRAIVIVNNYTKNTVLLPETPIPSGQADLYTMKMSISSTLRRLASAGSIAVNTSKLSELIKDATLTTGGPGAGKTEKLVETIKEGDVILAMTSVAVNTIKERCIKLKKANQVNSVMSLERASNMNLIVNNNLHVDEATQMSITSLAAVVTNNTKKLYLYGDTSQIGYVDLYYNVPGHRSLVNLVDLVPSTQTTKLIGCRRIGQPMVSELSKLREGFDTGAEHTTQWDIKYIKGLDDNIKDKVVKLLRSESIDVVLTALNDNVIWIEDALSESTYNCKVSTVFGFQSAEANNVAVLIKPNKNGSFGIGRHKSNIVSACTRGKYKTIVILINSEDEPENLLELITVEGAGVNYSKKTFELPVQDQQEVANKAVAKYPGASVKVQRLGKDIVYNITGPMGIFKGEMRYNKGKVAVQTSSSILRNAIIESIDTTELVVTSKDLKVMNMNLDKLRWLTWAIDKVITVKKGINVFFNMNWYMLRKTDGCPYASGIKITTDNRIGYSKEVLRISKWGIVDTRYGYVDTGDQFACVIATWLELSLYGLNIPIKHDSAFDSVVIPDNISSLMLMDRLRRFPECCMQLVTNGMQYKQSCGTIKEINKSNLRKMTKLADLELENVPERVVSHKTYIIERVGKVYNDFLLLESDGSKTEAIIDYSLSKVCSLFMWANQDIPHMMNDKIRGELDGLNMPLEKHKEHNTAVYAEYSKRLSSTRKHQNKGMQNSLWVSSGRQDFAKLLIKEYSDFLFVNTHTQRVESTIAEIMDGLLLLKHGSMGKNKVVVYAGEEPVLPSLYNKHYINLFTDKTVSARVRPSTMKISQSFKQIKSFTKAIMDDANEDKANNLANTKFTTKLDNSVDTILLGSNMVYYRMQELIEMLTTTESKLIGWIPTFDIDIRLGQLRTEDGCWYLTTYHNNLECSLDLEVILLATGMYNTIKTPNGYLKSEVMDTAFGMNLVHLTLVDNAPKAMAILQEVKTGDNIKIAVPWMLTNIKTILSKQVLFERRVVTIKPYLFRQLCLRLIVNSKTTLSDLLAYTRTLGSAYETSESNFRMKYSIDVAVLKMSAYAAWVWHQDYSKKFRLLKTLNSSVTATNPIVITNIMSVFRELLQLVQGMSTMVDGIMDELNIKIKDFLTNYGFDLDLLEETHDELRLLFVEPQAKIIKVRSKTNKQAQLVTTADTQKPVRKDVTSYTWHVSDSKLTPKITDRAEKTLETICELEKIDDTQEIDIVNVSEEMISAKHSESLKSTSGKNDKPTDFDGEEQSAMLWLLSRGIINSTSEQRSIVLGFRKDYVNNFYYLDVYVKLGLDELKRMIVKTTTDVIYNLTLKLINRLTEKENENDDDDNGSEEEEYEYDNDESDADGDNNDEDSDSARSDESQQEDDDWGEQATDQKTNKVPLMTTMLDMIGKSSGKIEILDIQKWSNCLAAKEPSSTYKQALDQLNKYNNQNSILKLTGKRHIVIMAIGSTGEIVPLLKIARTIINTGIYDVTFISLDDVGVALPEGVGWIRFRTNVVQLQQLVIKMKSNFSLPEAFAIGMHIHKESIESVLNLHCELLITNIINMTATALADLLKCKLLFTSAALERVDKFDSDWTSRSTLSNWSEVAFHKPMIALAMYEVAGAHVQKPMLNQLEVPSTIVYSTFPPEWLTWHGKSLKYNQVPWIKNVARTTADKVSGVFVLTGSTIGVSWSKLLHELHSTCKDLNVTICASVKNHDAVVCKTMGIELSKLPYKWKIKQWIDYGALKNCVIITHGGAGVIATITQQSNHIIVAPMIGDNFTNCEWLKQFDFVNRYEQGKLRNQLTNNTTKGKLAYDFSTDEANSEIIIRTIKNAINLRTNCKCAKKHVLIHIIGTRGDMNSIIPACKKILSGTCITIVTHKDHGKYIPSGWSFVPINTDSEYCASVARDTMNIKKMKPIEGLSNYKYMVGESLLTLRSIKTNIDLVVTNMFTPLSGIIGNLFKCEKLLIDAIPNRLFYVDGNEIATNLPLAMSETGNALRFEILNNVDENLSGYSRDGYSTEVVTCHKGMYDNFINEGENKIYNVFSDKDEKHRDKISIQFKTMKPKLLITFGSINCPHRNRDLELELSTEFEVWHSGLGNYTELVDHDKYLPNLKYPENLADFDVIIHHGGVGTTYHCMRAKRYQLIWPIFGDQHIWAAYVTNCKIGDEIDSVNDAKMALGMYKSMTVKDHTIIQTQCASLLSNYKDDTENLIKTMGLEKYSGSLTNKQLQASKRSQQSNCDIGQWYGVIKNKKILLNPKTVIGCALACVSKIVTLDNEARQLGWADPDYGALKNMLDVIGVNYILVGEDGDAIKVVRNKYNLMVQIAIIDNKTTSHAVLISSTFEPKTKVIFKTIARNKLLSEDRLQQLMEINEFYVSMVNNKKNERQDLWHSINNRSLNLWERIQRQESMFKRVKLKQVIGEVGLYTTQNNNYLVTDSVLLTNCTNDDRPGLFYVIKMTDVTILVSLTNHEYELNDIVVHRVESKVSAKNTVVARSVGELKWVFTNNRAIRKNKLKEFKNCEVYKGERYYNLIVNSVDNLQHDKFNMKFIIKQANKLIIVGEPSVSKFYEKFVNVDLPMFFENGVYYKELGKLPTNKCQTKVLVVASRQGQTIKQFNSWYCNDMYTNISQLIGETKENVIWSEVKNDIENLDDYNNLDIKDDQTFTRVDEEFDEKLIVQITQLSGMMLNSNEFLLARPLAKYRLEVKGAGISKTWYQSTTNYFKTQDWWRLRETRPKTLDIDPNTLNATAMQLNVQSDVDTIGQVNLQGVRPGAKTEHIDAISTNELQISSQDMYRMPNFTAMVFWEDTELIDWTAMYAPEHGKVKTTEWAQRLMTSSKHTLTKYPEHARPVHTKVAFEEHKSVTGRLFKFKSIRKAIPAVDVTLTKVVSAFFHDNTENMLSYYAAHKLHFDDKATLSWMEKHKMPGKVYDDLKDLITGGLFRRHVSDIKVHMKLESLLKDVEKVINRWEQQKARIIVWQAYAVAALFSPIFTEAKKRLHDCLANNVVYADGKTPAEMSSFMRGVDVETAFVSSNDLNQQDARTDDPLIKFECLFYKVLGVHEDVVDVWIAVHKHWRFKGTFTKGWRYSMRTSGQATTALGNAITTMQCNAQFVIDQGKNFTFFVFLGDDNAIGLKKWTNMKNQKRYIADNFNMLSNPNINEGFGDFCHFLIYKTSNGYWEIGPNYVRMRNRYEVTNGVSEICDENMMMRTMSYAMTIGNTREVQELVKEQNMPINPEMWYNQTDAIKAMINFNNMDVEQIEQEYQRLIHMMRERKVYEHTLTIMSSKPRKL